MDLGKVTADAPDGKDGAPGTNGRGIAEAVVNEDGELVLTYTDGETQNLGRVVGADGADGEKGADGKDGQDGKPGKDGEKGADGADGRDGKDGANAPAGEGSSVSDRCLPSAGIMALPLLALIPLGLAATMDVPALAPVKEQVDAVGASVQNQLPISPEMQQAAGTAAGVALAVAAIATLATLCSTEGGSSK